MEEYYIGPDMDPVIKAQFYDRMFTAYSWYFRKRDQPAEFSDMIKYAHWNGLKIKMPTKRELVDFFLEQDIPL
jgi:hypothetical protein